MGVRDKLKNWGYPARDWLLKYIWYPRTGSRLGEAAYRLADWIRDLQYGILTATPLDKDGKD